MPEHVDDPRSVSWVLPLDAHPALTDVRLWVRQRLGAVVTADKLDDIVLVVIELVTNADLHTPSPGRLAVSCGHGTVQIEVTDGDPSLPVLKPPSMTRSGGRGIALVAALSARWGVRRRGQGKAVWSLVEFDSPGR
ncbi:ATP-binding protein [Kibdelosporangium phytohabitans]|nr:ATP-binding protein [Kibdelosporangium phytohabitans]MBE1468269.1 anti-sigma regulatory factor (Ser/Thr protein kinase) [Kibdelosporangium phytohabitans]